MGSCVCRVLPDDHYDEEWSVTKHRSDASNSNCRENLVATVVTYTDADQSVGATHKESECAPDMASPDNGVTEDITVIQNFYSSDKQQ